MCAVHLSCISFKFACGGVDASAAPMHQAYLVRQRTENVAQISDHLAKSAVWGYVLLSPQEADRGRQMVNVEYICQCVCSIFNSFQLSALRSCVCVLPYAKCAGCGPGWACWLKFSFVIGKFAQRFVRVHQLCRNIYKCGSTTVSRCCAQCVCVFTLCGCHSPSFSLSLALSL